MRKKLNHERERHLLMVQLTVPLLSRQEWNCAKAPQAALPFVLEPHLCYLLLSLLHQGISKKRGDSDIRNRPSEPGE